MDWRFTSATRSHEPAFDGCILAPSTHTEGKLPDNTYGFPQGPADYRHNAIATRDHDRIRQWATRHQAQPATGEATRSGPATIDVRDDGAGIRFNFPGFGRFRPITWDEWFDNFEQYGLTFVYEREVADRAHELWDARGRTNGHDKEDWHQAERQLGIHGTGPSARYRFVTDDAVNQTPRRA